MQKETNAFEDLSTKTKNYKPFEMECVLLMYFS